MHVMKLCIDKRSIKDVGQINDHERFKDVSESTVQLTFKKLPLIKFWSSIRELAEKTPLPFQLHHLCNVDFCYVLQTKHRTTTG